MSRRLESDVRDNINMAIQLAAGKATGNEAYVGGVVVDDMAGTAIDVKRCRLDLIKNAKSFLHVSAYKLESGSDEWDEVFAEIERKLAEATSEQPFALRILLNKRGISRVVKPNVTEAIEKKVAVLRASYKKNVTIELQYYMADARESYHQKFWLADNVREQAVALIGSGDIWPPCDSRLHRRETCLVIRGPLADGVHSCFNRMWRELAVAYKAPGIRSMVCEAEGEEAKPCDGVLLVHAEKPTVEEVATPVASALIAGLAQSKPGDSVSMVVSNLNDPTIVDAIKTAIKRGVMFRFCAHKFQNFIVQSRFGGGANSEVIDELVNSLDPAYWPQLQVRWMTRDDDHTKIVGMADKYCAVHSKAVTFSRGMSLTGSSAYDLQARCSREVDVVLYGQVQTDRMLSVVFEPNFKTGRDYFIDRAINDLPKGHTLRAELAEIAGNGEDPDSQRQRAYLLCDATDYRIDAEAIKCKRLLQRSTRAYGCDEVPPILIGSLSSQKRLAELMGEVIGRYQSLHRSNWLRAAGVDRATRLAVEVRRAGSLYELKAVLSKHLAQHKYQYCGITCAVALKDDSLDHLLMVALGFTDDDRERSRTTLLKQLSPLVDVRRFRLVAEPAMEVASDAAGDEVKSLTY